MIRKAQAVGVLLASGGLLAVGTPAFADPAADSRDAATDMNVSQLPIRLCDDEIAVAGAVVPAASPRFGECAEAPIAERSETVSARSAATPRHSPEQSLGACVASSVGGSSSAVSSPVPAPTPAGPPPVPPPGPESPPPGPGPVPDSPPPAAPEPESPPVDSSVPPRHHPDIVPPGLEHLPEAPAPITVRGHHAVTG